MCHIVVSGFFLYDEADGMNKPIHMTCFAIRLLKLEREVSMAILEVCVDSFESAMAAVRGGADRLELCDNLVIGGTTPSRQLFREIRKYSNIPIHVLIRPRFGDFLYSDTEQEIMRQSVTEFHELGATAIVIGMLHADGSLDVNRMKELMELAPQCKVTLHRAFDVCRDPHEALIQAQELGVHTILTSGQQNYCTDGVELLTELVSMSKDVEILIGSGVNAKVIQEIAPITKATSFHMSGKKIMESAMSYRNPHVFMGLDGLSEYELWITDEQLIRDARKAIDAI